MRLIPALCLLIVSGFSTGCNSHRELPPDVSWVEPIIFSDQTKLWIQVNADAIPEYVWVDLERVAKHNDKCREILGKEPPRVPFPEKPVAAPLTASK